MHQDNFHGAFVLRKHDHGILSATYFNNGEGNYKYTPYPETAKRKKNKQVTEDKGEELITSDPFAGDYETTWLEENDFYVCNLHISLIVPYKPGVYKLSWKSSGKTNVKDHEGYGMLENGAVVGFYY